MSSWLIVASIGYFLIALEIVLDKFLLSSKRVSHPIIYAFYSGTLGLFALVFIPFGFHMVPVAEILLRFLAGVVFIYGMLFLFYAIAKSEASRVTPVVGAVIPVITFFLSIIFLNERLGKFESIGIALLIVGGIWISFDFKKNRQKILFPGFYWSIVAGIFLAISATWFKYFYNYDQSFINVYVWTRCGAFLGVISFFAVPRWRKSLFGSLLKFKKPGKEHQSSGLLFILAKATGGSGSILKEKATSFTVASVTVVNALVSLEYVFIFILSIMFSLWMPNIFEESSDWKTVGQKIIGILIITAGVVLVSGI